MVPAKFFFKFERQRQTDKWRESSHLPVDPENACNSQGWEFHPRLPGTWAALQEAGSATDQGKPVQDGGGPRGGSATAPDTPPTPHTPDLTFSVSAG